MNAATQNRLTVGVLTVLLAASTVAVASSVEGAGGTVATLAAGQPAGASGAEPGSALVAGLSPPGQPSAASVLSGSPPTGAATPADNATGAPVPPAATPGGASGTPDPGGPDEEMPPVDAAVVTPLLRTLAFGTNFAVKGVGCNLGGSLVGSVTTALGLSELASSAILEGVSACVQLAATSIVALEQLAESSTALNAANPAVDPLLELLATNVEILGTRYAEELAPFAETIVTLGPTIRYFIGGETNEGA